MTIGTFIGCFVLILLYFVLKTIQEAAMTFTKPTFHGAGVEAWERICERRKNKSEEKVETQEKQMKRTIGFQSDTVVCEAKNES